MQINVCRTLFKTGNNRKWPSTDVLIPTTIWYPSTPKLTISFITTSYFFFFAESVDDNYDGVKKKGQSLVQGKKDAT